MVRAGPWHARLLQRGEVSMAQMRARFMERHPEGSPLEHAPSARLIAVRRDGVAWDDHGVRACL